MIRGSTDISPKQGAAASSPIGDSISGPLSSDAKVINIDVWEEFDLGAHPGGERHESPMSFQKSGSLSSTKSKHPLLPTIRLYRIPDNFFAPYHFGKNHVRLFLRI